MKNDDANTDFYKFKTALRMLKRVIVLYFTNRDALPEKGDARHWYALGYHLIGGDKYLTDHEYDAIRVFRDFDVPPTADEEMEIRQGVSDRVSVELR